MTLKNIYGVLISITLAELAGIIGTLTTQPMPSSWYESLIRSSLTPPSWVFGPVWTILYACMGIAVFLVWQRRTRTRSVRVPLTLYAIQLILNTFWSILFFNYHAVGLALIDIALLWICIILTMYSFLKISKPAFYLLVPYILWVSFASYLNYAIYILN